MPPSVPCHYNELFIRNNGEIFPCCMVWNRPSLRIGHVNDDDIVEKIRNFNAPECRCDKAVLRPALPEENIKYDFLNIEFSLACQATCAMCCVNAPDWRGSYDYYEKIRLLIDRTSESSPIREIYVQGGEVLIQKRSLEFLEKLKIDYPSVKMSIATNGNIPAKMMPYCESLFDHFTVSLYGFQPETYLRIAEVEMKKTIDFCEYIVGIGRKVIYLKYLSTPINIHEAGLFTKWAIDLVPHNLQIVQANVGNYIKPTSDNFWKKIFHRTGKEVKKALVTANRERLRGKGTTAAIDKFHSAIFEITPEFVEKFDLTGIVAPYYDRTGSPDKEWQLASSDSEARAFEEKLVRLMSA